MTPATICNVAIIASLFLVGGCKTHVGHIQRTEPIRTTNFTGDHVVVAKCVYQRLGGKTHTDAFSGSMVIYNSAKSRQSDGFTHYSMTFAQTSPNQGRAEWRIVQSRDHFADGRTESPGGKTGISDAVVREFWGPVEECVQRAGKAA